MDRLSKERRSRLMSRVRSTNTTPELIIRSLVHRLGYRFRLHDKKLPGRPDLAFPGRKKVLFVHGCFWHGHENCPKGKLPKSNLSVWRPKISKNRERDTRIAIEIAEKGWKSLTIWQCELKDIESVRKRIVQFLG
jgi:DNA mismatch endonuclease, patch repair protein